MSRLYLIYGDYKEDADVNRCDYKIFAFRKADSPDEAFRNWLAEGIGNAGLFEDEVIIREVSVGRTYCHLEKEEEQ